MSLAAVVAARVSRKRRGSGTVDPLPTGNTALIASLGGNSTVLAFYDVRAGIANSGASLTSWADCRGASGFGPTIDQGVAGWDSTNLLVTLDGSSNRKYTALSSTFDIGALGQASVILVGALKTTAFDYHGGLVNSGDTRRLMVDMTGASVLEGKLTTSTGDQTISSGVAAGTTKRVAAAAFRTAPTALIYSQVPNQSIASIAYTGTLASENYRLILGAKNTTASQAGPSDLRAVIVLNRYFQAADTAAIEAWAEAQHGVTAA